MTNEQDPAKFIKYSDIKDQISKDSNKLSKIENPNLDGNNLNSKRHRFEESWNLRNYRSVEGRINSIVKSKSTSKKKSKKNDGMNSSEGKNLVKDKDEYNMEFYTPKATRPIKNFQWSRKQAICFNKIIKDNFG